MADDRLRKLVLMLSSDQPGEVAAAARTIDRELKAQGQDWNWLAGKLADNEPPEFHPDATAEPWTEEPWERRESPPPSEEPRYAEPEQEEPPAGPRNRLLGFYGRGKQVGGWLGIILACVFFAPMMADHHGGTGLALLGIGLILWGCVWLILNATREITAVIRWFSRSRA